MALQTSSSVGLVSRALGSQWDGPVACHKGSAGQVGGAVKALGVVAGVALLAKHGCARLQQRRHIGTVRGVAVSAILNNGCMLPQERAALFRVAGVAGLRDGVLHHQPRPGGTVRVVAVGAGDFPFEDGMSREAMKLGTLVLMATEAHFRLSELVQHLLVRVVHLMAVCASYALPLMRAARPVCPRMDA